MRNCPVCESDKRNLVWSMAYHVPDAWPLPSTIYWYSCADCGMVYGDGEFNQAMLDDYYKNYYGYGINSGENNVRLKNDAVEIAALAPNKDALIADFGGGGDDGKSILVDTLREMGYLKAYTVGVGDVLQPECDVIYASHVLEHIYDLPSTMITLTWALKDNGCLIIDVPDSMGILLDWDMPILDYNTKHINHFTLRNCLDLGYKYGLEAVSVKHYLLWNAPAYHIRFRRIKVAEGSYYHIQQSLEVHLKKLAEINFPVNVWGINDRLWYTIDKTNLRVLDWIDSDPTYRNKTYMGKPVLTRPTNDEPILIVAQAQGKRLVEYIHSLGIANKIIYIP